jgi:hypothetical protein
MSAMQMSSSRVYMIALAVPLLLAGCTTSTNAFPDLAAIKAPPSSGATSDERAKLQSSIIEDGTTARRAGEMVRAGDELRAALPPQP